MNNAVEIDISRSTVENDERNISAPVLLTFHLIERFELEVPAECKEKNFCENIPNYPEEVMKKLIKKLEGLVVFHKDTSISRTSSDNASQSLSLCDTEERIYIPKAIVNENGIWILVLNSNVKPVQKFRGVICKHQHSTCNNNTCFNKGYYGKCYQNYIEKELIALNEDMNKVIRKRTRFPSCCNCRFLDIKESLFNY